MSELDLSLTRGLEDSRETAASIHAASVVETELATPKDRAAAQILDAATCILAFWYGAFAAAAYHGGLIVTFQDYQVRGTVQHLAAALFVVAAGVYFFLMEWLAGGTVGKLLCRLRVRSADGRRCGFIAALLRNLLRPVDLFGTWLLILFPARRQRLGDRIADTLVIRAKRIPAAAADIQVAGWERRAQSAIIDVLLVALIASIYLALTGCIKTQGGVAVELRGYPLTVLLIMVFFYYVVSEGVYGATPGKALTGLRVVQRSSMPCGFTASTLRVLLMPLDVLPLGVPAFLLLRFTRGRQRLGDLLAGTIVVVAPARREQPVKK